MVCNFVICAAKLYKTTSHVMHTNGLLARVNVHETQNRGPKLNITVEQECKKDQTVSEGRDEQ